MITTTKTTTTITIIIIIIIIIIIKTFKKLKSIHINDKSLKLSDCMYPLKS